MFVAYIYENIFSKNLTFFNTLILHFIGKKKKKKLARTIALANLVFFFQVPYQIFY